jgi:hypothetical protein
MMEGLPYYYGGGQKKYLEGAIPVIILLLIAVVILGKTTNLFCGVPGLSAIFCGKGIVRIGIVGDLNGVGVTDQAALLAPELSKWIDKEGATYNIYAEQMSADDLIWAKDAVIKNYDFIILVGERSFKRQVKDAIGAYLGAGGKMIVIGDAATKDPDDPNYLGWGGGLFDFMPVRLKPTADINAPLTLTNSQIKILDIGHPIMKGYGLRMNLSATGLATTCSSISVVDIAPTGSGIIAALTGKDANNDTVSVPAVVEGGGLFSGKVFYVAFDPGCTTNFWISLVGYMTGKI